MTSFLQSFDNAIQNLMDPDWVKKTALHPANINPNPSGFRTPLWNDLSLSNGYPGLLLFFSELERQGMADSAVSHAYVLKIKESLEQNGCGELSLYGGAAGLCFALRQASHEGTRYRRMLESLHHFLLARVDRIYFQALKRTRRDNLHSSPRFYDPIQGIGGVGRYALENLSLPEFAQLAEKSVEALIDLVQPFYYKGQRVPGWYLASSDALNATSRQLYPKGNFNLGLAHGITGVLAFLSIALLRGIEVPGQKEAIHSLSSWIREKGSLQQPATWPYAISWEEEIENQPSPDKSSKDAWCYGVPGIARTLFLAGKALQNEELENFAAEAFRGVFQRTQQEWQLPGPSLCHGIAGLLLITEQMSLERGCEDLVPKVAELKTILLSFYQPEAPWGFKDVEACRCGTCMLNKPGFLEGAPGVLLTLLVGATSNWHLPLMIHA